MFFSKAMAEGEAPYGPTGMRQKAHAGYLKMS
jgi:hypothetical protein